MVSMMSNDDRCFACGRTGHFGHQCPSVQCYSCNEFTHFAQDCPTRFLPQEYNPHQDRSYSRHQYIHSQRDTSHSSQYGHRHGRNFNQSQSCHHPHCDRSSSLRRHTSCSSSSHCSSSLHLLGNGFPHCHSCCDTSNQHIHTPSYTDHFSHRCHSHHYCMAQSWSHSSHSHTHCTGNTADDESPSHAQDLPPSINPTVPRLSSSKTSHQILSQIQTVTLIL